MSASLAIMYSTEVSLYIASWRMAENILFRVDCDQEQYLFPEKLLLTIQVLNLYIS